MTARIGRRTYDRAPLHPSPWRRQLRRLGVWMLAYIAVGLVAGVIAALA